MKTPIAPSDLLTAVQAAALLHVKPDTLRMWRTAKAHAGKSPPFIQRGKGRVFYLRSDLDAWLLANRVSPQKRNSR